MNRWPDGALPREDVIQLLQEPTHWRVEWCEGARTTPTEGYGTELPSGVLERVPTRAKRRKFERGTGDHRTWVFARLSESDGHRVLVLHEGP